VKKWQVISGDGVETLRTEKSTAEQDAYILRWLGKVNVKVEEIDSDKQTGN
jgi:hypothetical protein